MRMQSDLDDAFAEGASRAKRNDIEIVATSFDIPIPERVRSLRPNQIMKYVVTAAQNKLKDAYEVLDMRARALKDAGEHPRFPRLRNRVGS